MPLGSINLDPRKSNLPFLPSQTPRPIYPPSSCVVVRSDENVTWFLVYITTHIYGPGLAISEMHAWMWTTRKLPRTRSANTPYSFMGIPRPSCEVPSCGSSQSLRRIPNTTLQWHPKQAQKKPFSSHWFQVPTAHTPTIHDRSSPDLGL